MYKLLKSNIICSGCSGTGVTKTTEDCTCCSGTGRYVRKKTIDCKCGGKNHCRKCQGTGKRTFYRGAVPCLRCKGTGQYTKKQACPACGHEKNNRYHRKARETVGTLGEVWETVSQ